jgi:uncharacterized protein
MGASARAVGNGAHIACGADLERVSFPKFESKDWSAGVRPTLSWRVCKGRRGNRGVIAKEMPHDRPRQVDNPLAGTIAPEKRMGEHDWERVAADLSAHGNAVIEKLMAPNECAAMAALFHQEEHFRSHIVMARHGFGKGEYRYFRYPLPDLLGGLRTALYARLAPIANDWNERMGEPARYPAAHRDFLQMCHKAGQTRPTPLLLQYVAGDFNALHQDLYGELAFPIQVAILLSEPGRDFTGGEFVLTEQRPRVQRSFH